MSAPDLSREKVLDFHAAACADALQHYPDLPAEVQQYLAAVQLCEYPEMSPMSYVYEDLFRTMLFHPVRILLVRRGCWDWEIVGAVRNYIQIVTKDNYYGHAPREVSAELMKYYDDL